MTQCGFPIFADMIFKRPGITIFFIGMFCVSTFLVKGIFFQSKETLPTFMRYSLPIFLPICANFWLFMMTFLKFLNSVKYLKAQRSPLPQFFPTEPSEL